MANVSKTALGTQGMLRFSVTYVQNVITGFLNNSGVGFEPKIKWRYHPQKLYFFCFLSIIINVATMTAMNVAAIE